MTALVLDAGFFISLEERDRKTALLKVAHDRSWSLRRNGAVIAEVWREGSRSQVPIARLLPAIDVVPIDEKRGRVAGELIREANGGTAVDATVVAIASSGDQVVTSDRGGIGPLVHYSGRDIRIVTC